MLTDKPDVAHELLFTGKHGRLNEDLFFHPCLSVFIRG